MREKQRNDHTCLFLSAFSEQKKQEKIQWEHHDYCQQWNDDLLYGETFDFVGVWRTVDGCISFICEPHRIDSHPYK